MIIAKVVSFPAAEPDQFVDSLGSWLEALRLSGLRVGLGFSDLQ